MTEIIAADGDNILDDDDYFASENFNVESNSEIDCIRRALLLNHNMAQRLEIYSKEIHAALDDNEDFMVSHVTDILYFINNNSFRLFININSY